MCIRDRIESGLVYPMVSLDASRLYSAIIIDNGRLPINDSITSVSYTHLDVYKRQVLHCKTPMTLRHCTTYLNCSRNGFAMRWNT